MPDLGRFGPNLDHLALKIHPPEAAHSCTIMQIVLTGATDTKLPRSSTFAACGFIPASLGFMILHTDFQSNGRSKQINIIKAYQSLSKPIKASKPQSSGPACSSQPAAHSYHLTRLRMPFLEESVRFDCSFVFWCFFCFSIFVLPLQGCVSQHVLNKGACLSVVRACDFSWIAKSTCLR